MLCKCGYSSYIERICANSTKDTASYLTTSRGTYPRYLRENVYHCRPRSGLRHGGKRHLRVDLLDLDAVLEKMIPNCVKVRNSGFFTWLL